MITTLLIIAGVCLCIYIVLAILSALLEWIGLAAGVIAIIVVAVVSWNFVSKAFDSPGASPGADRHASPAPAHSAARHAAPAHTVITNL